MEKRARFMSGGSLADGGQEVIEIALFDIAANEVIEPLVGALYTSLTLGSEGSSDNLNVLIGTASKPVIDALGISHDVFGEFAHGSLRSDPPRIRARTSAVAGMEARNQMARMVRIMRHRLCEF